ncbi:flagellar M-ring protein FliF [bacterium]|nr:flagellar M-ring protein FliF [FCB group bacterium]MBL7191783.1 flagellar M-ring protein FliF [bacterium]
MAAMADYRNQLNELLGKLSIRQRITLGIVAVSVLVALIVLMNWASRPKYSVLYTNLNHKDAGRIVDELKTLKVPYKVEAGGATILAPEPQVYELRMKFANLGVPQESVVGYEIFDQPKLGMTDFVQKLNYHRALEGELSRTLNSISEISQARVHIVVPKPALFEEDKHETTASVTVRLASGRSLNRGQVQGIANLVASSVEGLKPENITIVDTDSNILSADLGKDPAIALSGSQYELQQQVEKYLEDKAQSLLNGVLGTNRSIVRVSAELNFDKIESTSETFDPESQTIRSEETTSKTGTTNTSSPQPQTNAAATSNSQDESESTITNYEISSNVEHVVNSVGDIGRITVAVLVDGIYRVVTDQEGKSTREYTDRPPAELNKLASIVQNAIGFSPNRGDEFTISSFAFDTTREEELSAELADAARYEFWRDVVQKGFLALAAIGMIILVRILLSRIKKAAKELGISITPAFAPAAAAGPPLSPMEAARKARVEAEREIGKIEDEISLDTLEKEDLKKKLVNFIDEKPEQATQLVRTWLYEEEEK